MALGPRNSTLDHFDQKDELDDLTQHCRNKEIDEGTITDINVKTPLVYIKFKKQISPLYLLKTSVDYYLS